jgi:hypothetical protein
MKNFMKKTNFFLLTGLLFSLALTLNSCAAIEGIFKAGIWTGIIFVVVIIAIIIWIISRVTRK